MIQIAPSLLAANFARLQEEVVEIEQAGADLLHLDVMDGRFVPNISFGPLVIDAIRPHTKLPFDVHLMIEEPEKYIGDFHKAGANSISVHQEACRHLHRTIYQIKELGIRAGVVLNPSTSIETIRPVLTDLDYVLIMTINPGFGGQKLIPSMLQKITSFAHMIQEAGQNIKIQVDGGVNTHTVAEVARSGATNLVAGSAVFGREDRAAAISELRAAAETGYKKRLVK
ncbi:ribulose-phosphate 3-epimerase [Risungbinella massiliensis]|uniref:ribulose-phosphate 3-epimerase n=1 Tax=Risungbinella massiliensis TaxID=1329796 RepID=UPI0005CC2708|nr:ribulose-phosphate 3-epimerase [Risungbinella massiliensis]